MEVLWLSLCPPNAKGMGLIPDLGTKTPHAPAVVQLLSPRALEPACRH